MSKPLTAREARFVACYRLHGNAALAAREAGYAAYQTNTMGSKILHRPKIIAALRAHGIEIVLPPQKPGQPGETRRPRRVLRRGLTLRQERFVLEYLIDGNATQAAIRAGLPAKNPAKAGSAMLHQRDVAQAIERARAAAATRLMITADRVKNELAAIAFASIADVADWGPAGVTLKEKKSVAPQDRAAIAEFFCEKTLSEKAGGEKSTTSRTQVKMHSKQRALDALGKHLGLYGNGAKTIARRTPEEIAREQREANAELRERLMRIARGGAAPEEKKKE
jgi:phage terminase small subunit